MGAIFLLGQESGGGRPRRGQDPSLRGNRYMGGNGKVEGRACPAPTGWHKWVADERGKGGRQPAPFAVGGGCPLTGGIAKSRAGHARPLRTAVSGNGGSGALGGAQRAPPVCFANTLVRLFAPQGQTLLAPQFRCAQLWPRARNPATPEFKVEEGAGALRTKSNTAFV